MGAPKRTLWSLWYRVWNSCVWMGLKWLKGYSCWSSGFWRAVTGRGSRSSRAGTHALKVMMLNIKVRAATKIARLIYNMFKSQWIMLMKIWAITVTNSHWNLLTIMLNNTIQSSAETHVYFWESRRIVNLFFLTSKSNKDHLFINTLKCGLSYLLWYTNKYVAGDFQVRWGCQSWWQWNSRTQSSGH